MQYKNTILFSEKESSRFNCRIFRGNMDTVDEEYINNIILNEKPDIIVLRVPVEKKQEHYKLHNTGCRVLHCDTLVYYFCPLGAEPVHPFRNKLEFHPVTPQTQHLVTELTEEIFPGYQSHYFSNPYLNKELILQGYKEWTQSYINETDSSKFSWYITMQEKIVGFAMCSIIDDKTCEGVFSGVKAEFAGKGIYPDIVRFLQGFFKDRGMSKMKVSTQIQNYSVQKAWIKEGFTLKQAFDTYHLLCSQYNNIMPGNK